MARVSNFIKTVYEFVTECDQAFREEQRLPVTKVDQKVDPRMSLRWSDCGTHFIITDLELFTLALPKAFRHGNFRSFVRQLNNYGFRKIRLPDQPNSWCVFQHPSFRKGSVDSLSKITRTGASLATEDVLRPYESGSSSDIKEIIAEKEATISALRKRVKSLEVLVQQLSQQQEEGIPSTGMSNSSLMKPQTNGGSKRKSDEAAQLCGSATPRVATTKRTRVANAAEEENHFSTPERDLASMHTRNPSMGHHHLVYYPGWADGSFPMPHQLLGGSTHFPSLMRSRVTGSMMPPGASSGVRMWFEHGPSAPVTFMPAPQNNPSDRYI